MCTRWRNTDGGIGWLTAVVVAGLCLDAGPITRAATPVYRWTTLAGRASLGAEDGPRLEARFSNPHGLGFDALGNLFVADTGNHTIRKISPQGIVTTFAGSAGQRGSADGPGTSARFNSPQGLAVDRLGNVYVADTGNHTIRRIAPSGYVTTLAGQLGIAGTADGTASQALFDGPDRIAVGPNGEVYLSNHGVRKIAGGVVSTLAVPAEVTDADGRVLTVSTADCPAVDAQGFLYFSTTTNTESLYNPHAEQFVRLAPDGSFTIIRSSYFSAGDPGSTYAYRYFRDTVFNDAAGNLFVAVDVRSSFTPHHQWGVRMQPDGSLDDSNVVVFQTYLGQPVLPTALALGPDGTWVYTCPAENAIKSTAGIYAGTPQAAAGTDGPAPTARFEGADYLAVDPSGSVWVAEAVLRFHQAYASAGIYWQTRLRKIGPDAQVTTPPQPWYPNNTLGYADLQYPTGLNADGAGTVTLTRSQDEISTRYIVNQVFPDGRITQMDSPPGRIYDPVIAGAELYLLNRGNIQDTRTSNWRLMRRLNDGSWSPVAGGPESEIRDGTGGSARFCSPHGLVAGHQGNLYCLDDAADGTKTFIRRVTPDGTVTTVSSALSDRVSGLAIDDRGRFFLTRNGNHVVTLLGDDGVEVPVGGVAGQTGSADGIGTASRFAYPGAITRDDLGDLYVIDDAGATVREGEYLGEGPSLSLQPLAMTVPSGDNASFEVLADGTPAPAYQWYFNGTAIPGATSRTFALTAVRASDAGDYSVTVSNEFGSVTSAKATLTVNAAPAPPSTPPSAPGGSGGGAVSPGFLLALLLCGAVRFCRRPEAR